jgi:hypothetical protein
MWPYWFLFFLPVFRLISGLRPYARITMYVQGERWPHWWRVMFVVLTLMIGLRYEVGGDWFNYIRNFSTAAHSSLISIVRQGDPAYYLLNWVSAQSGLGIYFVNSVCAALFTWGLLGFCLAQPQPWLALVVAVPYLVTVVAMGYTRQGVAIGLTMLGLVALGHAKFLRFVLCLALAATFHKSAVILIPLAALLDTRRRVFTVVWVGAVTVLLYTLLLQDSVGTLSGSYLEAKYESSGAAIRVSMNALPAVLFLLMRTRFHLEAPQRRFWTWMAWAALALVGLLMVSPSSTAVDRVALYWIPMQLFVLSRLPGAVSEQGRQNPRWVVAVVAYSMAVLFVWLFFATNAAAWLPYKFYPLVWLFK